MKVLIVSLCLAILFVIQFFALPYFRSYAQSTPDFGDPNSIPGVNGATSIPDLTGIEEQVNLDVSPENPQPGETVSARVQAFGTDLNRAKISWYVNNVLKSSGTGQTSFTTQAGEFGKVTTISVKIVPVTGGKTIEKSFTLSAQDVDIIWEGSSFAPPFYKGKRLYGREGNVTLVALPNIINKSGVKVNPASLVYKWIIDDSVIGNKSGYGRNTFYYSGSLLDTQNFIEVEVTAADGTVGHGIILLTTRDPLTLFYENDPLYGVMFNQAITSGYKLKEKEIRIDAYPYFFSASGKTAPNISYAWALNNDPLPLPLRRNSAVFRNNDNVSGSTKISITTDNSTQIFQRAQTEVVLNF